MCARQDAYSGSQATIGRTVLVASRFGTVWLLDAATGAILWRRTTQGRVPSLAHSGELVYVQSVVPLPARKVLDDGETSPGETRRPQRIAGGFPASLLALRASDGGVAWERAGWSSSHHAGRIALNSVAPGGDAPGGAMLVADGPTPELGQRIIYGLDAATGAVRWSFDTGSPWGISDRLLGERSSRVYVYAGGFERSRNVLSVLDARSGSLAWSVEQAAPFIQVSQPDGRLAVASVQPTPSEPPVETVYDAASGDALGTFPQSGTILALADDGVAYVSRYVAGRADPRELVAMRVADGDVVWRAPGVAGRAIVRGERLYCYERTQPRERAEVVALDRRTGTQLWRWRSPGSLLGLLALWGWRTPQVMLFALAQARRSFQRARERHDWGIVVREVIHGQWRRPSHLVSDISAAADEATIYVGTSLGLFALRERDGRRLWYALPMMELGSVTPAVSERALA